MALVLKDRVKETSTSTGTGTITLSGAVTGYQSFSVIGDANTTYYVIDGGNTGEWEVGIGTYTASGTTLSRDTILSSSNSNNAVNFSAGIKNVFVAYPAGRSLYVDGTTITPGSTATLPITSGGTGSSTATFSGANITSLNASSISTGTISNDRTTASASNGASTIVARDASGNFSANVITANGSAITSINASNISSGTLANARTTATDANGASTIVARDANGSFSANVVSATTLTGAGSGITAINASNISSGTLANARTTASSSNGASTIVARDASGDFTGYNVSATNFIGTLNGSGANVTSINAANISTGTLVVARGGTGATTLTGLVVGNGTSAFTTVTAPSGTVVGTSDTQTLTNKRVTPRVSTTASSATPTINTDTTDVFGLTALTVAVTSFTTNLSGTPTDGQRLWIYIVGTAARAITWGASFEASTVALPTTTVSTNRLDVGFVWNAATSKWRCVAVA